MIGKGFWQKRYLSRHSGKEIDEAVDKVQAGVSGKFFKDLTYSETADGMVLTSVKAFDTADEARILFSDIYQNYSGIEFTTPEGATLEGYTFRMYVMSEASSVMRGLGYTRIVTTPYLLLMSGIVKQKSSKYYVEFTISSYELSS